MKKGVCFIGLLLILAGCRPGSQPGEEYSGSYPYDLAAEVDGGRMMLSWKRHGEGLISGYNIYVSETPLTGKQAAADPFNTTIFPGDTDPGDGIEHYEAEGLSDDVKYYVSVRLVYPDRSLSRPSEEVVVVCGPRGNIEIYTRYHGGDNGYSFGNDRAVPTDAGDNDLYFYSREGQDFLASPTRLNGFLRATRMVKLGLKGDLDEVRKHLAATDIEPSEERVEISAGDWVLMRTPENRHVLMKILSFIGEGRDRRVRLFFAYSGLEDELVF
jgi:hypothetical protein